MVKRNGKFNSNQNGVGAKGSVKSRLGINNRNLIGANKPNKPNIIKTGDKKEEMKLFTKHFDARSKIQPKQQRNKPKIERVSTSKGIAKKALDAVRSNSKNEILNKKRQIGGNKNKNPQRSQRFSTRPNDDRESTFTGKSIQVVARNNLAPKFRETKVKGKTLSITTSNTASGKRFRKNNPIQQSPIKNVKGNKFSSVREEYVTAATASKAPLPAKMIISNLHPNVTQDDIKELFGAVGSLREARLKNLGTAEVTYSNAEDAFAAYNKYNTRNLDGQPMILKITTAEEDSARPNTQRAQPPRYNQQHYASSSSSAPSKGRFQNDSFKGASGGGAPTTKPVVFTVRL